MTRKPIWSENGVSVYRSTTEDDSPCFVVFRPSRSGTHSETDSAYERAEMALARGLYLARGPGKYAAEAVTLAARLNA